MTKIIIDAWGSDQGPKMVAEALRMAAKKMEFEAVVVGPQSVFSDPFFQSSRFECIFTDSWITNEESPVFALRKKKEASLVLALHRLNEDDADALLSAGSTGALLAGGYFITKRQDGIERACLAATIPNPKGGTILVDTGATMDTTPQMLLQFAKLGSAYAEHTLQRKNPRVALLNIGVESHKGDQRTQETYKLLQDSDLHFIGNLEARELLSGEADVLVADGFSGNIALKTLEGTARTLLKGLLEGIHSSFHTKIGGLLLKKSFKSLLTDYNYEAHGGAPLLGVKKPLYKAHGNSSAKTFARAIEETVHYAKTFQPSDHQ